MQNLSYESLTDQLVAGRGWGVLAGAGISRESGLPLATELICVLLGLLGASVELTQKILNVGLPFEVLMDTFVGNSDDRRLLEVFAAFSGGEANATHHTLAALAAAGHIDTLATTNFDLLLESALNVVMDSEQYIRRVSEADFALPLVEDRRTVLLKLHGSLDDPLSLRATLRQVIDKKLGEERARAVQELFSAARHHQVVILGYSCSDVYDIIPAIRSIGDRLTQILLVDHDNSRDMFLSVSLNEVEKDHPLKGLPGLYIRCNTNKLMEHLAKKIGLKGSPSKLSHSWLVKLAGLAQYLTGMIGLKKRSSKLSHDWRVNLVAWEERLKSPIDTRLEMLGWILQKHQLFAEALECHLSSSATLRKTGEHGAYLNAMLNVSLCMKGLGNYSGAKLILHQIATTTKAIGDKGNFLLATGALAQVEAAEKNIDSANMWSAKCRAVDDSNSRGFSEFNTALVLVTQKRYEEAYDMYLDARRRYWETMDLAVRSQWLSIAGISKYSSGNSKEAIVFLEDAVTTAQLLRNGVLEGEARLLLGEVLLKEEQIQQAIEVLKPVTTLYPANIKHRERVRGCMALAFAHHRLDDIESSLTAWECALQIGEEYWPNSTETVHILGYAARQWQKRGDTANQMHALKAALFIAKSAKTTHAIVECHIWLGDANAAMGNSEDALMCYQEGLAELGDNQQDRLNLLCQLRIARIQVVRENIKEALSALGPAIILAQQLGEQNAVLECNSILALIERS